MSNEDDQALSQGRKKGKNQEPVINTHMHLINFSMVPNDYYRNFSKLFKLNEKHMKKPWFRGMAGMVTLWRYMTGGKFKRLSTMLDLFNSCMNELTDEYVNQMIKANIHLAVPLMMDLGPANPSLKPEVPFNLQVDIMHEQMIRHPDKFRPFVMFDPRRKDAVELCRWAYEKQGFGGIKMYPPLGYHPVPDDQANEGYHVVPENRPNDRVARDNLHDFYTWCQEKRVPITAHCSQGGAVAETVSFGPALQNYLCRPYNWRQVLKKYPELILNLAHFGGHASDVKKLVEDHNYDQIYPQEVDCDSTEAVAGGGVGRSRWYKEYGLRQLKTSKKAYARERAERSIRWREDIICLMRERDHVYADVSYAEQALDGKTRPAYFKMLNHWLADDVVGRRLLFGTDWLMTAHSWDEVEYLEPFRQNLTEDNFKALTWDNPCRFLGI
jgi:predicted TIM-barrel fold metal-dependent hydrolase